MENFVTSLIPALMVVLALRLLILPLKLAWKIGIHSGCGFLCLWLLNSLSGFTGIHIPINAVTVLLSGFLGIPGIGLMAFLETVM